MRGTGLIVYGTIARRRVACGMIGRGEIAVVVVAARRSFFVGKFPRKFGAM